MWVADVGQNLWEEINVITKGGGNYGWPVTEGNHCWPAGNSCSTVGLEKPVWEYSHDDGCSVTGGHVVPPGSRSVLRGAYVFADFCSGKVWGLRYSQGKVAENALLVDSGLNISAFGLSQEGELYVVSWSEGLYRLVPT